jgi:hypothetical protein
VVGVAGATGIATAAPTKVVAHSNSSVPLVSMVFETEVPFLFARGSPLVWALVVPSRTYQHIRADRTLNDRINPAVYAVQI